MDVRKLKEKLRNKIIGKKIYYFEETSSTNDEAKRLIKLGEGEGVVIIAERQGKGRGKLGRMWFSPQGGVYISVIIKPRINPRELLPITFLGALSVARTIKGLAHLDGMVKWPNDIILRNKKVGGVLTEMSKGSVVVGIGVNINTGLSSFEGELKELATSIKEELGKEVDTLKFLRVLLQEFDSLYGIFLSKGSESIISEWKTLSEIIGSWIKVKKGKEEIEGKVLDVGSSGELIIRSARGRIIRLTSGNVVKVLR